MLHLLEEEVCCCDIYAAVIHAAKLQKLNQTSDEPLSYASYFSKD